MATWSSGLQSALVLAFLTVVSVVAVLSALPETEAQVTSGCMQVAAYPDFSYDAVNQFPANVYSAAMKGGDYAVRTVRIANNCLEDMDEIRFLAHIRSETTIEDAVGTAASTTVTSASNSFKPWHVGETVFGICNGDQDGANTEDYCGIATGTTIVAISANGGTATLSQPALSCTNPPGSTACAGIAPSVFDGLTIGCKLPSNDPCFTDTSMTWIPDQSFAKGWTVTATNAASRSGIEQFEESDPSNPTATLPTSRQLIFKASKTGPLHVGSATCGDRVETVTTTVGSDVVTALTPVFADGDKDKLVVSNSVPGLFPPNTKVVGLGPIMDGTQITVSADALAPGGTTTVTIGTPPPCSTSLLQDTTRTFDDVRPGMKLKLHTGASAGEYTIASATLNQVTFTPPAPATVITGVQYSIFGDQNINSTLLRNGGLVPVTDSISRAQDFTIAFQVRGGSEEGTRIPIQIIGFKAVYPTSPPPVTPFETTCKARPPSSSGTTTMGWRCALNSDNTPNAPCVPNRCQSPSFYIVMDGGSTGPGITGSITRDLDMNGHIDRVDVFFTKRLDPQTFDPFAFTIQTKDRKPYQVFPDCMGIACDKYLILNGYITEQGPTSMVSFIVREQPYYDTGDRPFITYAAPYKKCAIKDPATKCGLRDLAGLVAPSLTGTSLQASDGAAPVMVGSWGRVGHDTLDLFFSEPVRGRPLPGIINCAAPNPCTATSISDTAVNFVTDGVLEGFSLRILDGPAAGEYTVETVSANTLTFSGNAPGIPLTGNEYRVQNCATLCTKNLAHFNGGGSQLGNTPCDAVPALGSFNPIGALMVDATVTRGLPAAGTHYRFSTIPDTDNPPGTTLMGPCDVHPLIGDSFGPRLAPVFTPNVRAINWLVGIEDMSGQPLVYLRLNQEAGFVTCGAPADCTNSHLTDPNGANFVTAGVRPGMTLRILTGGASGTYTVADVTATTLDFCVPGSNPCQGGPGAPVSVASGDRYYVQLQETDHKVWPSGGIEFRPHGFARHMTYPLVVRADMDIDHDTLRVQFNGPVRYARAPANRTDTGVTHADMDIASASGTGQGPQGFVRGTFMAPNVDTIYLKTDHPARPHDVDNSPSYLKLHCNKIQGTALFGTGETGRSSFVPCDDPDRFYGWDSDPAGNILKPDVAIVDVTPPTIKTAKTVDSNRDGYIDGVELTFSEPVNDASFCGGAVFEPDYCSDSVTPGVGLLAFHNPWQPNPRQFETRHKPFWEANPRGGFRWDTGSSENDNVGILQLVNTTYDAGGAPIVRTRNFETDFGVAAQEWSHGLAAFHRQKLATDYLPHLTLQEGMFTDLAVQPAGIAKNNVPTYCQLLSQDQYLSQPVSTLNVNGPDVCVRQPQCRPLNATLRCDWNLHSVQVADGAPPAIWRAQTVDTPFYDRDHCYASEKCHTDRIKDPLQGIFYGNGTIDGYKVTFSEPVSDAGMTSVCAKAVWQVAGFDIYSRIHEVTGIRSSEPNDRRTNLVDDNEITVRFNETYQVTSNFTKVVAGRTTYGVTFPVDALGRKIPIPDTGARPDLTYAPTDGCALRDLARCPAPASTATYGSCGNAMQALTASGITEEDGARPVIIRAGAFLGEDRLVVQFSEPVDDGARGPLVRDDFNYYDVDRLGVAGKSSLREVCHGDDDYIRAAAGCEPQDLEYAVIPLSTAVAAGDMRGDQLAAVNGIIFEIAPSVPVNMRQSVPDVKVPVGPGLDNRPPGAIRNLRVEDALTDPGSVTLSWTAPGSDGLGGNPVGGYRVKVGNGSAIADFEAHVNPTGVKFVYSPAVFALPNHTQAVQVLGLQPDRTYHFQVQAVDATPNVGPVSQSVSTHTPRDPTPPECLDARNTVVACPLVITSENCRNAAPVQTRQCTFRWTAAQDKQSPNSLRYHYKASKEELDRVLTTDELVMTNSVVWTFPENGTWYFHVAAFSGGGYTPTAHYKLVIGAGVIPPEDIEAANDAITVEPVRILDEANNTYLNEVRWTLPEESSLPGTVVGVEIWRRDGNTFVMAKRLDGGYGQLGQGAWTDNTAGAGATSEYRVHMVFAGTPEQMQADPQAASQWHELSDLTPQGIPVWAWIVIGVSLALLVAGLVIFFVLRGKQAEKDGSVAYAWESANPDEIGIDEATGLPVHEVRCPSCNNPFQAIGNLPLPVTCPNCGTTGSLD